MKVEMTKNHKTEKRTYLKNQVLEVMPWKAAELIRAKVAKELFKKEVKVPIEKAETNEKKIIKETR